MQRGIAALIWAAALATCHAPRTAAAQDNRQHTEERGHEMHDEGDSDHDNVAADHSDHDRNGGGCRCDGRYHARFAPDDFPEPFGFSLREGWFDELPHSHFSRLGTPQIHFFFVEPAYPDHDLFVDFIYTRTDEGKEYEIATELELAFTRRIGLVIEVPGVVLDPLDAPQREGFGDLVIAPRFLLADFDRFMMSFNLEIATPTGDADRGLGTGETVLGPSLTGWLDLGNWWTSGFRLGVETGLESGETEMAYDFALARTFCGPALFGHRCGRCGGRASHDDHGHDEHGHGDHDDEEHHFPAGMTSLIAEINARTLTSGPDDGRSTAELLFGVSYCISEHMQLRVGYQFPLYRPSDLEERIVTGVIWHF
ncbi:MAG: hypothetical protein WD875_14865 [Pirellulales bacterium]